MSESLLFFNSLSAHGILGTRFFEVMASGSINFLPYDDYYGVLEDDVNCIMYKSVDDIYEKIMRVMKDKKYQELLVKNGLDYASKASYENRLIEIERNIF